MQRIVAFLDLLGFTRYCSEDPEAGAGLLESMWNILQLKDISRRIRKARGTVHAAPLDRELKKIGIDSFEHVIHMSDSTVIVASDANLFVQQLSSLVLECLHYKIEPLASPENPEDPTEVTIRNMGVRLEGDPRSRKTHWYPVLYRAGIAFGEVSIYEPTAIRDGAACSERNVIGPAYQFAVETEKASKGRGPRLICHSSFGSHLRGELPPHVTPVPEMEGFIEILWPAFHYIESNNPALEIGKLNQLLKPALVLLRFYAGDEAEAKYTDLVSVIIRGTISFFEERAFGREARDYVAQILHKEGIGNRFEGSLE